MIEAAPTPSEAIRDLEPSPHDEPGEGYAREIWILRLGLWVAVGVVFAALALPLSSIVRMAVGVVALAPLMWIPSRLSQRATELQEVAQEARARRFVRLRSATDVMLDEVRRLNGLTVDAHRGVRDPEETEREVQAIEARLHALVDALRIAAGVEGGRGEATVEPDPVL
jgi:hypothetical protein